LGRVADSSGGMFFGGDLPGGGVGQETADELGVQGVAGFAGFDAAEEGEANQG